MHATPLDFTDTSAGVKKMKLSPSELNRILELRKIAMGLVGETGRIQERGPRTRRQLTMAFASLSGPNVGL
jgi:hypothetical protein